MKYTIVINQKTLEELAPGLDFTHDIIFGYIRDMCVSRSNRIEEKRIKDETGDWTWIDYEYLLLDLPRLKLHSKSAITNRIKDLETTGLIETSRKNKNNK